MSNKVLFLVFLMLFVLTASYAPSVGTAMLLAAAAGFYLRGRQQ